MESEVNRAYRTLRECTSTGSVSYGIVQPGKHVEDGVPIIRVNNINDGTLDIADPLKVDPTIDEKHRKTRLEGGEVLLSLVGTTGQCVVAGPELKGWNVARAIAVIKPAEGIDADWLTICLKSPETQHYLDSRANTTVQKTLNLSDVREIPILTVPDVEERYILEWWNTLNEKIKLNRQMNATLEGMAQALFKSWFVDFDPVIDNALAAGNPIPDELADRAEIRRQALANGTANRDPAKHFPAAFQETESMGWIPEGWEALPLDQVADFKNGLALQKFRPKSGEDPLPIVKIAQLKNGEATWDEMASPSITADCIIDDGDVVFSWSGSLMIDVWCGGKAALNQHLFKVTSDNFPKWFYFKWSDEHLNNFQNIAADKAVTMGHIKRSHLSEALCAVPGSHLIKLGAEHFDPILERIISNRLHCRSLTKLRDTLLPKLISGELRTPEAEQLTEEALA